MNINSYDIETYLKNDIHEPYCVSFYLYNNNYSFYFNNNDIILDSILFIFKNFKNKKEIFYIHNLKFDGTLIISSISKYNYIKINALIEEKQFYLISLEYENKIIEFRCSYKLLPISLSKIAIGFNIQTKKIDYPYSFINENNLFWIGEINSNFFKSIEGWKKYMEYKDIKLFTIIYCENDCFITKNFVERIYKIFLDNLKIDIVKKNILSTPSLSFFTFYNKFNNKKIDKHILKEKENYIRDSYFGGRCEVFGNYFNKQNIFHFDFPGMYGICMKEKNVFGNSYFVYNINQKDKLKPGFYNIDWYSNMEIPVLPHHNQINNKLLFCNGNGNGTYWFEEIELFKKMGGIIKKINSGLIYENYDFIFNSFVDYFEKFRNINEEYKILGKLIINSFYGRTGLSIKEDFSFFINKKEDLDFFINCSDNNEIEILNLEEINKIWLITIKISSKSKKIIESKEIYMRKQKSLNIAIASSIASKARIKLYEGFNSVINNKGRILYCDTDSIFAEFNKDISNQKMGEIFWDIKKEDTKIIDSVFISPKTYGLVLKNNKEIIKIKGITRNYLKFEELKNKFYNKEKFIADNIKYIRYIKKFKIENFETRKNIDLLAYDKRKFLDDLKITKPFFYENGSYK